MRASRGKLEFHYHHSPRFFLEDQIAFERKVENEYHPQLTNYINASVLMSELISSYELPLEPYELWMSEAVNQQKNKNYTHISKKISKKSHQPIISKFLTKKAPKQSKE